jgi:DNA-binding NarL/FixJ family response regulator
MTEIRVLIVEDDPIIAEEIRSYLTSVDYQVSTVAYDRLSALQALSAGGQDIVLLDINLEGGLEGIEIAEIINRQHQLPFVFLTSYSNRSVLDQAKRTRPMGYLVKPFDERDLFATLEIALYNFSTVRKPTQLSLERINEILLSPLTPKEFELLLEIFDGQTNRQMSEKHFISVNTIKTHLKHLYDKLQVHTRTEVISRINALVKG